MDGMIKISTAFSFLWSILLSGLVWLTAGPIASGFLGDPSLRYPILSVCPLMILMSISNIVKGHFLGLAKIKIPSAINISEKILRFPILYTLIRFCLNHTDFPPVTLVYLARAVTPGTYQVPQPQVESMYAPQWRATGAASGPLTVTP